LRQIRNFEISSRLLINKAPFQRLVRKITKGTSIKFQRAALEAIQEASEMHIVSLLKDCNLLAVHTKRSTVKAQDWKLALRLRGQRQ
jgi:histone H3